MTDRQPLLLIRRLHALSEAGPADAGLLDRYLDGGDAAALDSLARRHGPMVLRVARRVLADAHDADDVFQATFLALARRAGSIRKGASLASWLHGVAYRLALKVRAMAARRQVIERRAVLRRPADPLEEMTARELLGQPRRPRGAADPGGEGRSRAAPRTVTQSMALRGCLHQRFFQ